MNHSAKPRQKPDYNLEMMDGELLLYHLNETKILYFNETASLIWQLCDGRQFGRRDHYPCSARRIPKRPETMAADVEETVLQFLAAGCIEMV